MTAPTITRPIIEDWPIAPTAPAICDECAQTAADLERARDRISDPTRWCQWRTAESIKGQRVPPASSRAVRWCAVGSLMHTAGVRQATNARVVRLIGCLNASVRRLWPGRFRGEIRFVNDLQGYFATMRVFDHAIASIRAGCTHT